MTNSGSFEARRLLIRSGENADSRCRTAVLRGQLYRPSEYKRIFDEVERAKIVIPRDDSDRSRFLSTLAEISFFAPSEAGDILRPRRATRPKALPLPSLSLRPSLSLSLSRSRSRLVSLRAERATAMAHKYSMATRPR